MCKDHKLFGPLNKAILDNLRGTPAYVRSMQIVLKMAP